MMLTGEVLPLLDPNSTIIIKEPNAEDVSIKVSEAASEYAMYVVEAIYPTVTGKITLVLEGEMWKWD